MAMSGRGLNPNIHIEPTAILLSNSLLSCKIASSGKDIDVRVSIGSTSKDFDLTFALNI
jgi:hypothetical protein